ncbi:MAG: hypothetical protein EA339_11730 [Rhodobacteraceae bacterium]|nr:MAG: hypothetical protein EA339_11730 [Paracoccaceae bacterium]
MQTIRDWTLDDIRHHAKCQGLELEPEALEQLHAMANRVSAASAAVTRMAHKDSEPAPGLFFPLG